MRDLIPYLEGILLSQMLLIKTKRKDKENRSINILEKLEPKLLNCMNKIKR
jgi:hypothetical protein